ncbi:MAG TPA: glycosyltransferase family 39 protein [Rhizomicrobium sp.]|nr:glycosyltransferase family 39 protein [Rhizomicrobium sp.]
MSNRLPLRICIGALALFCVVGVLRSAAIAGLHVPLDPNEGWNAYHALQAMTGGALYPPRDSFLFNNYPPLSFYVVGALGSLIGDNIVAARILSLLATLAIAAGIYLAARRMKSSVAPAVFAALAFVAGLLIFTDYVGMDDPQLLGHAVAMGGLLLLVDERRTPARLVTAALLMSLAFFIKHNLVALPLALTLWLAVSDRRSAVWFAGAGIVFGLAGLVLFRIAYHIDLFGVLNSPRTYSFALLSNAVRNWLLWADVSLFGLAVLLYLRRRDSGVVLCAIYAAVAIAVGIGFAGGAGVDMNIWFDAMIALGLATALVLDRLAPSEAMRGLVAAAYMLPLIVGIVLNWDSAWLERDFWLHPMREETATGRSDIAFLEAQKGPALCETLALCYWAGKREEVDVFNIGQAYATHRQSDDTLVHNIAVRRYGAVAFDSLDDFALTQRIKQTILKFYRIDHANDEGVFLVPR